MEHKVIKYKGIDYIRGKGLIRRTLGVMLSLLLVFPVAVGAHAPARGVIGADGNPLSSTSTYAGSGEYADNDGNVHQAAFASPEGVLVLQNGVVLVADTLNHRIRQIEREEVSTFAGLELIMSESNERPVGTWLDGDVESAVFHTPKGMTVDQQGNVYVADAGNHAIRKISTAGLVTTIAGDGILGDRDGQGSEARFYSPSDVAVTRNGTIYVADTLNHQIRRIDPYGTVTTLNASSNRMVEVSPGDLIEAGGYQDGPLEQAKFNEPSGIALDAQGNLYVSDAGNHLIRYIDLTNKTVTTVAGHQDFTYGEEALYAAGGYQDGVAADALFNFPKGIAVTDEGGLVIADSMNHSVRYLYDGQVTTLAGNGMRGNVDGINGKNRFEFPTDVAINSDGDILITDTYNQRIRLFTLYQLPTAVYSDQQIDIVYGTEVIHMDTEPIILNGRTMVPVRAVSEHLGYTVEFDTDTDHQKVNLISQEIILTLTINKQELMLQDDEGTRIITMDVAPFIKDERTFVPLRFFSEAFGYDVEWDNTTRTVILR